MEGRRNVPIYRIVLTGGPGSGKTSALARLAEYITTLGYVVYTVPEVATELISAGFHPWEMRIANQVRFQVTLMELQEAHERAASVLAHMLERPSVLLCDRGKVDSMAYVSKDAWSIVQDTMHTGAIHLRESAYDAVLHLSAPPRSAYTRKNNAARTEDYEAAVALDQALLRAWTGHPRHMVIPAYEHFDEKLRHAEAALATVLGGPVPREHKRKYLVDVDFCTLNFTHTAVVVDIDQCYLAALPGYEDRIRRRRQGGASVYTRATKQVGVDGIRTVREQVLSPEEYFALSTGGQTSRLVEKTRYYQVLDDGRTAELDIFSEDLGGLYLLEVGSFAGDQRPPPQIQCITIRREVTTDPHYYNSTLAVQGVPEEVFKK